MEQGAGVNLHRPQGAFALLRPVLAAAIDRIDRGLAAGRIDLTLPDGERRMLGGRAPGPNVVLTLSDWRAIARLVAGGSSGWYRAWAAGEWSSPDPVALFELFTLNRTTLGGAGRARAWSRPLMRLRHWLRRNDRAGSRRNIAFHYDLGNAFYAPWLSGDMTYSSAMFAAPGEPLEIAQARKLDAVLARTGTRPGERTLEIGCGWGSFAELAARGGRHVHALTLSEEQKRYADQRMADAGLSDRVTVALTDYRDVTGQFDAVASIEMVEAVGEAYWPDYLATIARVLKPGGRAAIQYIAMDDTIFESYASNVDFIQTYIFPGGMLISESRFRAIAQDHGLGWHDRRGFGPDYAETLRIWRERFDAADRDGALPSAFDARFRDMWRYYLMYCEGGFRGGAIDVAHVTLVKEG
ncbi:cyclopropane-fatty-acyl-phospholipid synthase [Sphingomonas sp. BGYR3]|uniref:SAM-dependent methyltransferase n=1 Tax=Sphingomonas sp. BGYR3 TaxID=2975483 RepID=UPI0021A8FE6E|nr:cyclopropane-fatty-acyl-phospholipid synthase family protein [Sphingomonas sp. BGYR3]MDG5487439.1 cyclopropane-fatty-acyl-phospholipid synthase [Sphingomonas sp. BGYR3]